MTNKLTRRAFFSKGLNKVSEPFQDNEKSVIFQDVKLKYWPSNSDKYDLLFLKKIDFNLPKINNLTTVSFAKNDAKKTDNFYNKFMKNEKLTPQNRYIITNNIEDLYEKHWDKTVWISEDIPETLPKMACPLLIIQDIEDFNPQHSPAELLPNLPKGSDIFIAQQLDLSDKNNPATKRVYDFLGLQPSKTSS